MRIVRTAGSTAVALALAGTAPALWAAGTCSTGDISGCGASGGDGASERGGAGGVGNGQGGGSSTMDTNGVTVPVPGAWGLQGTGGTGASGDGIPASDGSPAVVIASGNLTINTSMSGLDGSAGTSGTNFATGGNGGNAGLFYSGREIFVAAALTGGAGGKGGAAVGGVGNGGGGGGGGAGMMSAAGSAPINNSGTITGGAGGVGGSGAFGGGGGGGGDGLLALGGRADIVNTGTITGGAGGAAGTATVAGGTGGSGGIGVNLAGTTNALANAGTISGGAGLIGGVGVRTRGNDSIVNAGLIMGGMGNGGTTRAAAIEFGGLNNALKLLSGSVILGDLLFDAGASATIAAREPGLTLNNAVVLSDAASNVIVSTAESSLTMSGAVSGAGTLTLGGIDSNVLTMTSVNTYTGATTIGSGTLALTGNASIAASSGVTVAGVGGVGGVFDISGVTAGTSIKSLSGGGAVRLGGQTLSLTNAAGTFDGVIDGAGGVHLVGGTQTLTGVNTYSGATTVDNGAVLALTGSGSVALSSGVTNNGTLDISATTNGASLTGLTGLGTVSLGARTLTLTQAAGVFSGTIAGTGGLTLNGGTQTLAGANTYTGATTINAGTLALGAGGQLSSATTVTLAGSGATFDASAAGALTLSGLSGAAGTRFALGASTLTVDAATNATYAGDLTGSGVFVKQGAGMLVLNGASSAFTGTTTVGAGALEIGDAAHESAVQGGNVAVGSQGTLRGHGTILGNVTNGGIVAPGGSIGTLSVAGNYTQASNATLAIEVSPTTASLLKVSGSATLNGVLAITYDPGTYRSTRYTLLSAVNGVSGRFSSVTEAVSAGTELGNLRSALSYGANDVTLALNESASGGLGASDPSGGVVIAPKNTSVFTALGTAALMNAQSATAAVLDQATRRSVGTGLATGDATSDGPTVWANATGLHGRLSGADGQPGFQENRYGFLAGAHKRVAGDTFGLAGGYSHADLSEAGTANSGMIDTLRLAAYASREIGPVDVAASVGYGLDFISQKRPFAGIGTAQGDHIGQEFTAAAQASAPLSIAGVVVTPRVGLRYAYFHANGFDESGAGGQDLRVGTDNTRSLQPFVGVTFDKAFGDAVRPMHAQFRAAYAHELLDAGRAITVASQDGTIFVAPGTRLARGYLTLGASFGVTLAKHLDVSLAYDALINTARASAQAGSLKVTYRF
ncbi:autotransporter domain-containing protein [Pandoraea fibrosis]|nr:autotransporter domain-containing protein [Pandoraea fibrosis]